MAFPSMAQAAPGTSVRNGRVVLESQDCDAVSAEAVRRIVGIEIGDLLVQSGAVAPSGSDRLFIRCEGDRALVHAVGDTVTPPLHRTLYLNDFPGDAAPRAMALAGLEVLAALSPAVRERLSVRQNPPNPAPALPPNADASERPEPASLSIGLAGIWRTFMVEKGSMAWGGRVDLTRTIGNRLLLEIDVDLASTRKQAEHGQATGLLSSVGLLFGARAGDRNWRAAFTLGGRMGLARLAGDSLNNANVTSDHVLRPWGGPAVRSSLLGRSGSLGITAAVEAGLALISAKGMDDDKTILALRGSWVAISLGGYYHMP
jgi:hypothetical protein